MSRAYKRRSDIVTSVLLLFVSLLLFTSSYAQPVMPSEDKEAILNLIDQELLGVEKNLLLIEESKSAAWAQSDHKFYNFWLQGLKKEREALYEDAIQFYKQAYNSGRYEMSTYAVLLPLGRVYVLSGEKDKAISSLKEFIKEAERELSSISMWELTPESEEALRKDMERAEWLLNLLSSKPLYLN